MSYGPITLGIERLLSRYPLLGAILASWDVRLAPIATMGVGLGARGFELAYDPSFVESISLEELVGVLHHEVRHVVFGHPLMDPEDYPDTASLTIAQEVTVNEGLREPLPGDPILLKNYPQLPPNEDTERRYHRLARDEETGESKAGEGDTADGRNGDGEPESPQGTIDDHTRWDQIRAEADFARNLIDAALQEALSNVDRELSKEEKAMLGSTCEGWGLEPGSLLSQLDQPKRAERVRWRQQLRRYVGQELDRSPSYARPPRRFPHLLGIVPGIKRQAGKPRILAAIDTSGSMDDEILSEISQELAFLAREREVTVVEFDADIQRTYKYRRPITEVQGRGGTDFCPVLEASFLARERADLVVVFTDGCGPAPEKQPQVPVVWVLTSEDDPPAKWGG